MTQSAFNPPWFVRKDLDGFFGLMIDNLIQLILIVGLCRELIHLSRWALVDDWLTFCRSEFISLRNQYHSLFGSIGGLPAGF